MEAASVPDPQDPQKDAEEKQVLPNEILHQPITGATSTGDLDADDGIRRFMRVRIDDLHVDHSYQRDLSLDLVEKIARDYDPAATSAITVSRRANGDMYIVNGQHRAAGAKRAGEEYIHAEVFDGLTQKQESALRLKGNTRRTDRPQERFAAQVSAGDPESLAIVQVVEQFDTKVNRNPDANRGINAVSSLEEIYRRDRNGTILADVLAMIQDSLGEVHGRNVGVSMLKGVAFLLERNGSDMDRRRMVDKIKDHGVQGIHRIATNHKAAMGGAMWTNYYRAMIEVYNERLGQAAKLEWRTTGYSKDYKTGGESNQ
jgi:hypothetical protein